MLQAEQLGTGHAVRIALDAVPDGAGTVVVINGDVPLLRAETVARAGGRARGGRRGGHRAGRRGARPDRPGPDRPGRRRPAGADRRGARRRRRRSARIREINAGIYAFDAARLREALGKLSTDNDQGEEYLTDVFGAAALGRRAGGGARAPPTTSRRWAATTGSSWPRCAGCCATGSTRRWMRTGVSHPRPRDHLDRRDGRAGPRRGDRPEHPAARRHGGRRGRGGRPGRHADRHGGRPGRDRACAATRVGAEVGPGASVGPVRVPAAGARLAEKAKVGTFVETKNSEIGAGSKVPHLSYVGDATIGDADQHRRGDGLRQLRRGEQAPHRDRRATPAPAADNMFVAPVEVGDGAYTAAGSVISRGRAAGRAGGGPGAAAQHRGLGARSAGPAPRRPQAAAAGRRAMQRRAEGCVGCRCASDSEAIHGESRAGGRPSGAGDTATE